MQGVMVLYTIYEKSKILMFSNEGIFTSDKCQTLIVDLSFHICQYIDRSLALFLSLFVKMLQENCLGQHYIMITEETVIKE